MTDAVKSTIDPGKSSNELLPPKGDPKVGHEGFKMVSDFLSYRSGLGKPETWNQYYRLRRNKHWKRQSANGVTLLSANLLGNHHQKTVNMLTDNNPTFNVAPAGDMGQHKDGEDPLMMIHRTADHWWINHEQQHGFEESVSTSEMYGFVVEKVHFDVDNNYPLGEVEAETIDPFYVGWWPPKCKKPQKKALAWFHFEPMSVSEAKRKWPAMADQIRSDSDILKDIDDQREEITTGTGEKKTRSYLTSISNVMKSLFSGSGTGADDADEMITVEIWARDYTQVPDEKKPGKTRDLYSGCIRRVTIGCCGELVLDDQNNPSINPELPPKKAAQTYLWSRFPFSLTPSVTDPASAFGMADYEQLESLNIEIDKTLSQMTLVKDKSSRVKIINPKDTGVPNEHLDGYPGVVNPISGRAAQGLKYLDPPKIDPQLSLCLGLYKDLFFTIAGSFDLESAQTPGREVIAYKAIAALLENANRMNRGKDRNYGGLVRVRGRMALSCMQNWYTEKRWINYSEDGDDKTMSVRGIDLIVPASLLVVSGSTMPKSQVQQREEALTLADKGHIDTEELLKKLDWKDYKSVLKRKQLGVIGMFLEKIAQLGMPQVLLELMQQVSAMEDKDLESAIEKGEIPPIPELLQQIMQEGQDDGPPEMSQLEGLELAAKDVEIKKAQADIGLIEEKIRTEQVIQAVKGEGVKLDWEAMRIRRAETASKIRGARHGEGIKEVDTAEKVVSNAEKNGQGPYQEKGMKSNNQANR